MNRHERRKARSREQRLSLKLSEIDSKFDIQVDGKHGSVVMVFANSAGRKVAEDMWPDIEWSTDNKFSRCHSDEWRFTHIRVTRLPPHLEEAVPLAFASAESLGFAVASALHRRAWPLRVAWWSGDGTDIMVHTWGDRPADEGGDLALYADYVPPGRHRLDAC
jgi:hypothetical protein